MLYDEEEVKKICEKYGIETEVTEGYPICMGKEMDENFSFSEMMQGLTNKKSKCIKKWKFFQHGFYISLIIWACGMAFSMIGGELFDISPVVRIISIFVPLGIYMFFLIGKSNIEEKIRKNERC